MLQKCDAAGIPVDAVGALQGSDQGLSTLIDRSQFVLYANITPETWAEHRELTMQAAEPAAAAVPAWEGSNSAAAVVVSEGAAAAAAAPAQSEDADGVVSDLAMRFHRPKSPVSAAAMCMPVDFAVACKRPAIGGLAKSKF